MTLVSEKWSKLDEAGRKPYIEKNLEDQERYKNEVAAIAKDGFFMTKDDKRSCDVPAKKKVVRKQAEESCLTNQ